MRLLPLAAVLLLACASTGTDPRPPKARESGPLPEPDPNAPTYCERRPHWYQHWNWTGFGIGGIVYCWFNPPEPREPDPSAASSSTSG